MAGAAGRLIALTLVGIGAAAAAVVPDPVQVLAGRYASHFLNTDESGRSYPSDNLVEIVPVDATHAYVHLELQLPDSHLCSLAGIATRDGDTLVYRGSPDDRWANGPPCHLTIHRHHNQLTWDDGDTCKAHCGLIGSFSAGNMPWSSKRPITHLDAVRQSRAYQDALAEWRAAPAAR